MECSSEHCLNASLEARVFLWWISVSISIIARIWWSLSICPAHTDHWNCKLASCLKDNFFLGMHASHSASWHAFIFQCLAQEAERLLPRYSYTPLGVTIICCHADAVTLCQSSPTQSLDRKSPSRLFQTNYPSIAARAMTVFDRFTDGQQQHASSSFLLVSVYSQSRQLRFLPAGGRDREARV